MKYSLDTSCLTNAWKRHYRIGAFRGLWDRLAALGDGGILVATEEVLHELERKDDDLHKWAKKHRGMFLDLDGPVQEAARKILRDYRKLVKDWKNRSGADPFVIALAKVNDLKVITEEGLGGDERPKIPFVCDKLGIECIRLADLIDEQGWNFVMRGDE